MTPHAPPDAPPIDPPPPDDIEAAVDEVLDTVCAALVDTPADRRAALILELAASLVDVMMTQATDPAAAADMIARWAQAGLAVRRQQAGGGARVLH